MNDDIELDEIMNNLQQENLNSNNKLKPTRLDLRDQNVQNDSIENIQIEDRYLNSVNLDNNYSQFFIDTHEAKKIGKVNKYNYTIDGAEPKIYKKKIDEKSIIAKQCETIENLDNEMMVYDVERLHPRRWKFQGGLEKFECCVNVGCFSCGKEKLQSELTEYGGVTNYFRILKALIYTFMAITLLNSILIYLYANNSDIKNSKDLKDYINLFSIGNSIKSYHKCNKIPIDQIYNNNLTETLIYFNMTCEDGETIRTGLLGLSTDLNFDEQNEENCINYSTGPILNIDTNCDLSNYYKTQTNFTCDLKSTCIIGVEKSNFPKCEYNSTINQNLFMTYTCTEDSLQNQFSISFFLLAEGIIDGLSMIGLILCSLFIYLGNKESQKLFNRNNPMIGHFTCRIYNLGIKYESFYTTLNFLINHINLVFKFSLLESEIENTKSNNVFINESQSLIYEINYPIFHHKILDLYLTKEKLNQDYKEVLNQLEMGKRGNETDYNIYEENLRLIKSKISKHNEKIKQCHLVDIDQINEVFVTFKEISNAIKFTKFYNKNRMIRCCLILFCKKEKIRNLYFNNKWLDVEYDPETPSNILWQNFGYSKFKRFCCKFGNLIFCFLLFILGLGIVLLLRNALEKVDKEFLVHIECSKIDLTNYIITNDLNISKNNINAFCYCKNIYVTQGYESTNNLTQCQNWIIAYSNLNLVFYIVIIAIPILNLLSRILLKLFTKLERNKTILLEKNSLFYKIFFVLFINSSANYLLMNMYLPEINNISSIIPILNGLYKDFDNSWWLNIGSIIILSFIINIIEPHLVNLIHVLVYCIMRKKDSGNMIGKNSQKMTKRSFYDLYLGPEFNIEIRLANIISSICVSFLFSSGLPILYPIILISLVVYYWMDKWLYLHYFKSPNLQIDRLSNQFVTFLLLGISLHSFFGIWIHGSFANLYNTALIDIILEKITLRQNYLLVLIAVSILIFLLFRCIFYDCFVFIICRCCKDETIITLEKQININEIIKLSNNNLMNINNNNKISSNTNAINKIEEYEEINEIKDKNLKKDYENIIEENKYQNPDFKFDLENEGLDVSEEFKKAKEMKEKYQLQSINSEIEEEINIYEALPLTTIYKNYTLRKLQYVKANKIHSGIDLRFLIDLYKKNIDNDRKSISIKLTYITGNDYYYIENFDEKIKNIMEKYEDIELSQIKGDQSYNIAYIKTFESLLYSELLKD